MNVKISDKALNDMVSQINNALQGIKMPNMNIGSSNGGNILGNNVAKLEEFRKSLSNIGMSSNDIDTVAQRIENLGVKINSLNQSEHLMLALFLQYYLFLMNFCLHLIENF